MIRKTSISLSELSINKLEINDFMLLTELNSFELPDSGVYCIKNTLNSHCYIGSSNRIKNRLNKHLRQLNSKKHHSVILQRAWDKYRSDVFEVSFLEILDDENKLLDREQFYIDLLHPEYNICKIAGCSRGVVKSEETKNKLRVVNLGKIRSLESIKKQSTSWKMKYKNGYIHPFLGKHQTEDTKSRLSKNHSGENNNNFGKHLSEETKKKISSSLSKSIRGYNNPNFSGNYKFFNKKYGTVICSRVELTDKYKLNYSKVSCICNGTRNTHKGWVCIK